MWILLTLSLFFVAQAKAQTTLVFTGNSFGEYSPCPS